MDEIKNFDILLIGFDLSLTEYCRDTFNGLACKSLSNSNEVEAVLENFQLSPGTAVFISTSVEGMSHLEVAQALNSYFQGLHLIFLTLDRSKFEVENLKKNGFSEILLLPLDKKIFNDLVDEITANKKGGGTKKYKAVKLVDIQPGISLPFEVRTFLPANKKYVVLTGYGQLSDKKVEILKQKNTNSVYIDTKDIEKFYEFSAEQLLSLGNTSNDAVSETEKAARLQSSVRGLFRSLLDASETVGTFDAGRDLLDQSKKVVEHYLQQKTGLDINKKFQELTGEGRDLYSHAQIVSTLAFLLSMATEIGNPEDLAIAGLMHDIGIHGIAEDISIFELDKLSPEEKKQYMLHPRTSLNLLKEKRVTLTPKVADIIEKHHERVDGKGFPDQLLGHRIPFEAQLLAYADAFEYLTRTRPGVPALSPVDAHALIVKNLGLSTELTSKVEKFLISI